MPTNAMPTNSKRPNRALYLFLGKALLLYIVWNLLYQGWISKHTLLEQQMTSSLGVVSSKLMNRLGYNTTAIDDFKDPQAAYSKILLDGQPLVLIAHACNGLTLLVLFIGFILIYPGDWKVKTLYILLGSILIYLINVIRILILLLNMIYFQGSFDFNHKYTYTIAVYVCVFVLWMLWANRFSKKTLYAYRVNG
jgi:exosortase family protein XrtF